MKKLKAQIDREILSETLTDSSLPSLLKVDNHQLEQKLTTPPTLEVIGEVSITDYSQFFMEYQMTVAPKIRISSKEASIFLMMLNVRSVLLGVDHTSYLLTEWLYSFLLKSGSLETCEYPQEKGKQSLMLAELILVAIRGSWLSLDEREKLPEEVIEAIISTGWLPNEHTIASWSQFYGLRRFFKVRTVRLDSFQERESNSERYDSYTRGYGEGGKLSRVLKTPLSFELDGDDSEKPPVDFSLTEVSNYNQILTQIERWKTKKKTIGWEI